jgi:hypothetical protein
MFIEDCRYGYDASLISEVLFFNSNVSDSISFIFQLCQIYHEFLIFAKQVVSQIEQANLFGCKTDAIIVYYEIRIHVPL